MITNPLVLTTADYEWGDETSTKSPQYTESEIAEALGNKALTAEMVLQMHDRRINWQINVGGKA